MYKDNNAAQTSRGTDDSAPAKMSRQKLSYTRLMSTLKALDGIPGEYARDARMETPVGPERRYALDYGIQL